MPPIWFISDSTVHMQNKKLGLDDRPTVAATYPASLVQLVKRFDISVEDILADTGMVASQLEEPEARISVFQLRKLIERAYALTQEPALGFYFGAELKVSSHGFLGFAALSSLNARSAIELVKKYTITRTNIFSWDIFDRGNETIIQIEENFPLGDFAPFAMEAISVNFFSMASQLLGENVPARGRVRYSKPSYQDEFHHLLPCTVEFDADANQIIAPRHLFDQPFNMADPIATKQAESQCEKELANLGFQSDLLPRIRKSLMACEGQFPQLEMVADQCHMSPRTLNRQLAKLQTSYQDVLDEVRKLKAIHLLEHSNMNIEDVANKIGFSDASNFSRAFKKWTGNAPGHYRKPNK